jgi:hypothetical protein
MNQTTSKILIFPAGMARAVAYHAACNRSGQQVLGASSLSHDPVRKNYTDWAYLPYITAPDFDSILLSVIAEHGVTQIFTPNPVVWAVLAKRLPAIAPEINLVNAAPAGEELSSYRFSRATAALLYQNTELGEAEKIDSLAPSDTALEELSQIEFTALFHHAQTIPGMCDHQKFVALCKIALNCPTGDVVEIGTWWGKSAFILSQLARRYHIGSLLCVDPWSDAHLIQGDEIVDATSATVSADEAFQVFLINLLPYHRGDVNYIRSPSTEAAAQFGTNLVIKTDAFGQTAYRGKISLLHIDANHAFDAVNADAKAWIKFVIPGGWIIFDDYTWPYGDGPQRVADAFCRDNAARIQTTLLMGGALFIKLQ